MAIVINISRVNRTFALHTTGRRGLPGRGEGVPVGGTTGQILKKRSNQNYDTEWTDQNSLVGALSFIYAVMFGD